MEKPCLINFDQAILELQDAISEEEDEREQRRFQRLIVKLGVLREIEQKPTKTKTDVKKAMSITCYKNIGYCCGLAKDCIMRDSCRQAIGIDDETYVKVKEKMIWEMIGMLPEGGSK
jgi:hypothetical protein